MQMPATARIAVPMFLALLTWVIFNASGIASQGLFGYLKSSLFPPGVPWPLYILVVPIEFVSKFLVQPFSHTVRLFANLLAGHILLVTFATLSSALWIAKPYAVIFPLPVAGVIAFTAFELLVSFLQAYVFTLLAGVYIGSAISHEH
jgi:F-type H+-transporting ATPase subunit a